MKLQQILTIPLVCLALAGCSYKMYVISDGELVSHFKRLNSYQSITKENNEDEIITKYIDKGADGSLDLLEIKKNQKKIKWSGIEIPPLGRIQFQRYLDEISSQYALDVTPEFFD